MVHLVMCCLPVLHLAAVPVSSDGHPGESRAHASAGLPPQMRAVNIVSLTGTPLASGRKPFAAGLLKGYMGICRSDMPAEAEGLEDVGLSQEEEAVQEELVPEAGKRPFSFSLFASPNDDVVGVSSWWPAGHESGALQEDSNSAADRFAKPDSPHVNGSLVKQHAGVGANWALYTLRMHLESGIAQLYLDHELVATANLPAQQGLGGNGWLQQVRIGPANAGPAPVGLRIAGLALYDRYLSRAEMRAVGLAFMSGYSPH